MLVFESERWTSSARAGAQWLREADIPIAVFAHNDKVYAVDNRCPHMGFPLDRGTVKDGILTCHWHHARFDLSSGGTFDPFADDVRSFPVSIVDEEVWVDPSPPEADQTARWSKRLEDALEDNIRLVIAKSVLGLEAAHADYRIPLGIGAEFGTTYSCRRLGTSHDNPDMQRKYAAVSGRRRPPACNVPRSAARRARKRRNGAALHTRPVAHRRNSP